MTRVWKSDPSAKVEADSTEITNESISIALFRPENALSYCRLLANDYKGINFISLLDVFTTLKISFRYGSDSWTKVFEGIVEDVGPVLLPSGQTVQCLAYDYGRALRNTFCNTSYGAESKNPTKDTPVEIWQDLVDNFVNKSLGSADNTGYAITKTYIENITSPTINHILSPYLSSMDIINQLCQIYTGYRAGSASVHWFVDSSQNLRIKTIGSDQTGWSGWWDTDQATSTLIEKADLLQYQFNRQIKNFANKILLATQLRKPGYDVWTESKSALWGAGGVAPPPTISDVTVGAPGAPAAIVGSKLLEATPQSLGYIYIYYPSSNNAGWDFTKIGAPRDAPTLNFYVAFNNTAMELQVRLNINMVAGDYFQYSIAGDIPSTQTFKHFSIPIGPYFDTYESETKNKWTKTGNADWANINNVQFRWLSITGEPVEYLWLDDLHFSGKIIREAYNSWSISGNAGPPVVTAKKEHQMVIHMESSVDDTMKANDVTGTAAYLAYAELLAHCRKPLVGTIITPGIVDILPGQKVHIHADQQSNGNYRIDQDFRVLQIIHNFDIGGFRTTLELTDDLINSFAKGPSESLSALYQAVFTDIEAKNLKATGINPFVPRLSKDYQFDDD